MNVSLAHMAWATHISNTAKESNTMMSTSVPQDYRPMGIAECQLRIRGNPCTAEDLDTNRWNEIIETENLLACLKHCEAAIKTSPHSESSRAATIGITRFLIAVKNLGQTWYRFGGLPIDAFRFGPILPVSDSQQS